MSAKHSEAQAFEPLLMQGLRAALHRIDKSVLDSIGGHRLLERRKTFTAIRDITALGGDAFLIIGGLTLAALQASRMGEIAAFKIILFLGLARGIGWFLKALFKRTRPPEPVNGVETFTSSFPSIHTLNAFCVFSTLGFVATGNAIIALTAGGVIAALVAATRLIFRVHWPSDVLAGYLGGLVISTVGLNFL